MLAMLLRIIKTEGIGGTFRGFSANMINTFSQRQSGPLPLVTMSDLAEFAYFFFHTLLRTTTLRRLQTRSQTPISSLSTSTELLLGAGAGALAQIFTIPVAVIATRQQLWSPTTSTSTSESAKPVRSPGLLEVAQEIIAEGGPTALWTGLKPGLVLTVNPAITYGVFERLKSWSLSSRPREGGKLSVAEAFWLGVGSKTLATVVTYPYIFVRRWCLPVLAHETGKGPTASNEAFIRDLIAGLWRYQSWSGRERRFVRERGLTGSRRRLGRCR